MALLPGEPGEVVPVTGHGRRHETDHRGGPGNGSPVAHHRLPGRGELRRLHQSPGMCRVLDQPGYPAVQDDALGPPGMHRREQRGQRASLGHPEQRCPPRAGRVEYRDDVGHPLLERRCQVPVPPIRQPAPPPVEQDQPGELREPAQHRRQRRLLPLQLQMGHEPEGPHQVRAVTHGGVGDVNVASLGVPGLWLRHGAVPLFPLSHSGRAPPAGLAQQTPRDPAERHRRRCEVAACHVATCDVAMRRRTWRLSSVQLTKGEVPCHSRRCSPPGLATSPWPAG
jgi:hypothetical protein